MNVLLITFKTFISWATFIYFLADLYNIGLLLINPICVIIDRISAYASIAESQNLFRFHNLSTRLLKSPNA